MNFSSAELPSILLLIAIGLVIGAALTKILGKSSNNAELQQKLQEAEENLKNYQQEVGEHFQKTATLVNNLTESYREVHTHLSTGAQTLAKDSPAALEASQFKALEKDNGIDTGKIQDNADSAESKPS